MPGTASRKEKRAAASRVSPSVRAIVIVTPEREVPGISASACAQPIRIASRQPTRVLVALTRARSGPRAT